MALTTSPTACGPNVADADVVPAMSRTAAPALLLRPLSPCEPSVNAVMKPFPHP